MDRVGLGARLFVGIVAAASCTAASAQDVVGGSGAASSVYAAIRLGAGSSFATSLHSTSPRVTAITGQDKSSDFALGSVALGFRPAAIPFRLEVEATWRGDVHHRIDAVGACTVALCGANFNFAGKETAKVRPRSLMANAFYDMALGDNLSLFVGGGVGIAQLRSSAVQRFMIVQAPQAGIQTGSIWPGRTSTNLAFSATAGLARRINDRLTLEAGGRYMSMGRYNTGFNTNLFADERFSARLSSAEGFLGVRFGL